MIEIIQKILSDIELEDNNFGYFLFKKKIIWVKSNYTNLLDKKEKVLVEKMTDIIYLNYYINHHKQPLAKSKTLNFKSIFNDTFKIENNWLVEHINSDGSIIVIKNNKRIMLAPGKYYYSNQFDTLPQKNTFVSIIKTLNFTQKNENWVYFFGDVIDDNFNEALIRFYFNISVEYSLELTKIITTKLNKLKISFQFKCLKNANDYTRADAGVLYLDKRYFFNFKPILTEILAQTKSFLKADTPLFTLKLQDGVGFAENPPNPNESFGMSRCRLIAEGIWRASENNLPKSEWANFILKYIENQGYNLDKFYLNPNSRFPYNFE